MNVKEIEDSLLITLSKQLGSSNPAERQLALERLADLGGRRSGDLVIASLDDSNEDVKITAMVCLMDLQIKSAIRKLIDEVKLNRSDRCVQYALFALSRFSSNDIYECLIRTLDVRNLANISKIRIARQLWKYPFDDAIRRLADMAQHEPDRNLRSTAADSLFFIFTLKNNPAGWEGLWRAIAQDHEVGVSSIAEKALQTSIGG